MRLTTKRCYAVVALLDVALNEKEGPVSLADISMRHHISQSYLEQLFSKLRRHGFVKSIRGPGGGYLMNRPVASLSVVEVLRTIDDTLKQDIPCSNACGCNKGCNTRKLWQNLSNVINDYLKGVTFADLVSDSRK